MYVLGTFCSYENWMWLQLLSYKHVIFRTQAEDVCLIKLEWIQSDKLPPVSLLDDVPLFIRNTAQNQHISSDALMHSGGLVESTEVSFSGIISVGSDMLW